jgi:hypothetical protein
MDSNFETFVTVGAMKSKKAPHFLCRMEAPNKMEKINLNC